MDPVAIAELWKLGPVVTLLIAAVWYFHKRDQRNDARAEARHKACEERNETLNRRVEALESRQFDRLEALADSAVDGLAKATAAIKRSLGDHPTPPEPFPAIPHPDAHH